MRPFADVLAGQVRMVRDLGRSLGKQVRLEIEGEKTQVDRDVLEKLEAPLTHLLRNAVDHGIEMPDQRLLAGKPAEGLIRLRASHQAGLLVLELSDDGNGVDLERLRGPLSSRHLSTLETVCEPERRGTADVPGSCRVSACATRLPEVSGARRRTGCGAASWSASCAARWCWSRRRGRAVVFTWRCR